MKKEPGNRGKWGGRAAGRNAWIPALCLVVTSALAGHGVAADGEERLRQSVLVSPVFSSASATNDEAGPDRDGYRQVRVGSAAVKGASDLFIEWLAATGRVAPIWSGDRDNRIAGDMAPLRLQVLILAFEHRRARGSGHGAMEAYVKLGVRITHTRSASELYTGTFEGTAPAKGSLARGLRAEIFHNGIGAYLKCPLGQAFRVAARRALGIEPNATSGVMPLLARVSWEASVTGRVGDAYRINAGRANGLRLEDDLTPFAEAGDGDGLPPERSWTGGLLRIRELSEHEALASPVAGAEERPGSSAGLVQFGRPDATSPKAAIGSVAEEVPNLFVRRLDAKLIGLEQRLGLSSGELVHVNITKRSRSGQLVDVEVSFVDRKRKELAHWTGLIPRTRDAALFADRCLDEKMEARLRSALAAAPAAASAPPTAPRSTPRRVPASVVAAGENHPLVRQYSSFRAAITGPGGTVAPGPLDLELRATQSGYASLFILNSEQEFISLPNPKSRSGTWQVLAGRPTPLPLSVEPGDSGQDMIVAVVWASEQSAADLMGRKLGSIADLDRAVRRIAASRPPVPAEPPRRVRQTTLGALQQDAQDLAGEESGAFAVALFTYSFGPKLK